MDPMAVPVIIVLSAIVLLCLWVIFGDPSSMYQRYLQDSRLKKMLGEYNKEKLKIRHEQLKEMLAHIPVVNLTLEELGDAEDMLGINVQPINFDEYIIKKEITHSQYADDKLQKTIVAYATNNQMPIRTMYRSTIRGVPHNQAVDGLLKTKYTNGCVFALDELLSPQFIDVLLSKKIVLLGICKYGVLHNHGLQVLLLPYEIETEKNDVHEGVKSPRGIDEYAY